MVLESILFTMKSTITLLLTILMTGCAVLPTAHPAVQAEVILNYTWWNNLAEQPIVWLELRNTTHNDYTNFTMHVKSYNTQGEVVTAFDITRDFVLLGGEKRAVRVALLGRNAASIEAYMVGYDLHRPDPVAPKILEAQGE